MQRIKYRIFFLSSILALSLSGCETMSPSECRMADWNRQGYMDGQQGENQNRIAAYADDCGKVGVRPNPTEYRRGWDAGIVQFCTATNGWSQGIQGNSSKESSCQGQIGNAQFAYYFKAGMDAYRSKTQFEQNNQEINRLQKRLEDAKTPDNERRGIRDTMRHLDREQYRLRDLLAQQQRYAP